MAQTSNRELVLYKEVSENHPVYFAVPTEGNLRRSGIIDGAFVKLFVLKRKGRRHKVFFHLVVSDLPTARTVGTWEVAPCKLDESQKVDGETHYVCQPMAKGVHADVTHVFFVEGRVKFTKQTLKGGKTRTPACRAPAMARGRA